MIKYSFYIRKEGGSGVPNLYGCHFEYENESGTLVSSRTYNLIFAAVDTSRLMQTEGVLNGVSFFSKRAKRRYLIDDDFSESPLTFDIEIVTEDNQVLTYAQRRAIEGWLFNRHEYRKLYIDNLDDCDEVMTETVNVATAVKDAGDEWPTVEPVYQQKRLYLNCRFVNPERIESVFGVHGYKATLEADGNMWYQDQITVSVDVTRTGEAKQGERLFRINVDTDIDAYTYPNLTITMGNGWDYNYSSIPIIIKNNTDDTITGVARHTSVFLEPNAVFSIDGETGVYDYVDDYGMAVIPLRLLPGENEISVTGDVTTIDITYYNRRAYL